MLFICYIVFLSRVKVVYYTLLSLLVLIESWCLYCQRSETIFEQVHVILIFNALSSSVDSGEYAEKRGFGRAFPAHIQNIWVKIINHNAVRSTLRYMSFPVW